MSPRENGTSANAASRPLAMAVPELIFCGNVQRSLLYNTLTQLEKKYKPMQLFYHGKNG